MQRSFIDARIEIMLEACARFGLRLPPFAFWSVGRIAALGFVARTYDAMCWSNVVFSVKPG